MAEIKVKLSQTSQSFGSINISQTSQSIGTQISGTNTEIVPHDDTLKGSGTGSSPLGIADSVLQDIDNRVEKTDSADKVYGTDENGDQTLYDLDSFGKVDDVLVDGQSVVVDKVAEIDLSGKVNANVQIQGATHTKIQYDNKGLVTGGSDLTESDIPSLHLSKISDITATANEVNALDGITGNVQEQLNTKANSSDLASVATSGDYNDLSNTPTIGDGTLTVQKNNTTIDTFSANSTSNTTINIEVPTDTGDLTNGADYQTGTDVSGSISTHNESASAHSNIITPINNSVGAIEEKIPSQASSSNQLADKNFVNSSIATNTANFIGTFNSVADLEAYSGTLTNNDYAFVIGTDTAGNTVYDRYKYTTATTPASWVFEYELNNSSFTAEQWAAINSGATTTNIGKAETAVQPSDLSTVATTGSYNDLLNKPTIPAAQVNSDWSANSGVAQILNKPTLATVATSGSYNDLSNKPTIPTVNNATLTIQKNGTTVNTFTANSNSNVTANITVPTKTSDLTNDDGFITGVTSGDVTTALGYTPVNPSSLATVATTGQYSDLSGKPTIPTVGNGTITITQGGTTKGTFTTNQGTNTTVDLDAGGTGRNVGDIFYTMRNDNELNGAVECNGETYNTTNFTGAQSIGSLLAEGKVPYVSLSQYATALATNGSVGVFGWDGGNATTFRVPSLNDIFVETGTAAQIGDFVPAGLPDHTHQAPYGKNDTGNAHDAGTNSPHPATSEKYSTIYGYGLNSTLASASNSIYGNSNTVQPKSVRYRAMVQLATAASDEAVETCTSVMAQVAANTTAIAGADYVVESQLPTAGNNYTWYRKYKSGWVEQGGRQTGTTSGSVSVSLPVTMADTDYSVQVTSTDRSLYGSGSANTTTQITVETRGHDYSVQPCKCSWQVSGMSAS